MKALARLQALVAEGLIGRAVPQLKSGKEADVYLARAAGDLSEFNVPLTADGPVIIDLPQAVDAAGNNHAPRMLLRDVDNLRSFFGRHAPALRLKRRCSVSL